MKASHESRNPRIQWSAMRWILYPRRTFRLQQFSNRTNQPNVKTALREFDKYERGETE